MSEREGRDWKKSVVKSAREPVASREQEVKRRGEESEEVVVADAAQRRGERTTSFRGRLLSPRTWILRLNSLEEISDCQTDVTIDRLIEKYNFGTVEGRTMDMYRWESFRHSEDVKLFSGQTFADGVT